MQEPGAEPQSGSVLPGARPPRRETSGGGSSTTLTGVALWSAILAILVWIGFSIFLVAKAGTNETEWTRIAWIFGSIQAVAFAAAGALFGTSVQQQNVSNARQQAESAKEDADQQREAATRGRALAAALQSEAAAPPTGGAAATRGVGVGGAAADAVEEVRQRHAQLSRALFGDLSPDPSDGLPHS
jgi:hypothetical protein